MPRISPTLPDKPTGPTAAPRWGDKQDAIVDAIHEAIQADPRTLWTDKLIDTIVKTREQIKMGEPAKLSGDLSGSISEDEKTISGKIQIEDPENSATIFNSLSQIPGQYGVLTINGDGAWSYNLNTDVGHLREGDTLTEDFTIRVLEAGFISDVTADLKITIVGKNDVAEISGAFSGSVEEGNAGAVGVLSVIDPDTGEAFFQDSGTVQGTYGTFQISSGGSWVYTLNNDSVQHLNEGQSVVDQFPVQTVDGTPANVVVAINGVDNTTELAGFSVSGTDSHLLSLVLGQGDTFEFNWQFDAGDYMPYNDYAYLSVNGQQTTLSSVSQVGDYGSSGENQYLFTAGADGTYTFVFGVDDEVDGILPSTLTVSDLLVTDNFVLA